MLGLVVSPICYFFVSTVKSKFGYDDSLDVFGVHGVGGIIGALGTGILTSASLGGTGYVGEATMSSQFMTQLTAVVITIVWSGIVSAILFKVVDLIFGLRPTVDAEREGLDLTSHGEVAYTPDPTRGRGAGRVLRRLPPVQSPATEPGLVPAFFVLRLDGSPGPSIFRPGTLMVNAPLTLHP